jgi:hypothetical protein
MCLYLTLAVVLPIHHNALISNLYPHQQVRSGGQQYRIVLRDHTFLVSGQEQHIFFPDFPSSGAFFGGSGGGVLDPVVICITPESSYC